MAAVPVLAGCEAGGSAPVLQWHQPNDGANLSVKTATTGIIGIHDLFILGDAPGSSLPAGSSASVFLVLANTGPRDRLVSMTAPGAATRVKLLNGRVAIPRSSIVKLSGPEPSVIMHGLTRTLVNGTYVRMVLHFQKAGYVALSVPVMARADYFASYSPAPSQSATPVRSALPKKHPRPTVSPSPTGSAPSPAVTPSGKTHTFNP